MTGASKTDPKVAKKAPVSKAKRSPPAVKQGAVETPKAQTVKKAKAQKAGAASKKQTQVTKTTASKPKAAGEPAMFVGTVKSKTSRKNAKPSAQDTAFDLQAMTYNTVHSALGTVKLFLIGFVCIFLLGAAIYWIGTQAKSLSPEKGETFVKSTPPIKPSLTERLQSKPSE